FALRVTGSGTNLNLGGNTLTVGQLSFPNTLMINPGSSITNGTMDMGGRDFAIYAANTAGTNTATFTNGGTFTKTGPGAFVVGGGMSYTGKTYIGAGQIQLNVDQALPGTTDLVLSGNAAGSTLSAGDQRGILNLNGHIQNINSLSGNTLG